jgi:hypothetical protein
MSRNIECAIRLYNEAAVSEEQGNFERAEMLYMESHRIFEHEGDTFQLDAAIVMKMIAFMKERHGDHSGALAATQESLKVLTTA